MADSADEAENDAPVVLVVGGGFAGLDVARGLGECPVSVILADHHNYHLFQPLLYQVANAVLSPADIASPIRHILKEQKNAEVVLDELTHVDLDAKIARFQRTSIHYDYLVLSMGVTHSYFGHEEWEAIAPGLKTIDDALELRRRVLLAFEEAEREEDETSRRGKLTFVVVGGGPTGVEMAGALKEIASRSIPHDFRYIDTKTARIILVEAGERLLNGLPEQLGERARRDLERMGVEVRLNSRVTGMDREAVYLGEEYLPAQNLIWAAGVQGAGPANSLGVELDSIGRIVVGPDLAIPGHPEAFVAGDLAHAEDPQTGKTSPGLAPAAKQMGRHIARVIKEEIGTEAPTPRPPFRYRDKGTMATIGRFKAVAAVQNRTFAGAFAWLLWSFIHIYFLVGFRRRLFVVLSWMWNYLSFHKGARLITGYPEMRIKKPRRSASPPGDANSREKTESTEPS